MPVAGALATVGYSFVPGRRESTLQVDRACLHASSISAFSLIVDSRHRSGSAEFRFEEDVIWIGSIGAHYHVGVDGISLWLVLLTTLLMPIAILSSWTAIQKRQLSYYVFLLIF